MSGAAERNSKRRVVVLCPMQIEHRAVARAVKNAGLSGVEVVQTGIGREAVVEGVGRVSDTVPGIRAFARRDGGVRPPLLAIGAAKEILVILAGACGALSTVEDVPRIGRVMDEHGHVWEMGEGVTLIGVDRVVSTPADKRALAERTGAAIVDMESHAFIGECERMGLAWSVVRGVSDTPEETLPEEVLRWVTPGGDTRVGAAVMDMVRRPRLVGHIVPVVRRSNRVLPKVGERVVEVVRGWRGEGVMR